MDQAKKELLRKTAQLAYSDPEKDGTALLFSQAGKNNEADIKLAASTLDALKKIKFKIPSWHACKNLLYQNPVSVEQSSSEITAKYKARVFAGEKQSWADFTGGLGADAYFISRKAGHMDYYERNADLADCAEWNFACLGTENIDVRHETICPEAIALIGKAYDTVYVDPARRDSGANRVYGIEDCAPDVIGLKPHIFDISDRILLKLSPMIDIKDSIRKLGNVSSVHVLSVKNECKELIFELAKNCNAAPEDVPVHAVNINSDEDEPAAYSFSFRKENSAHAGSGEISALISEMAALRRRNGNNGQMERRIYLHEPYKCIIKAGAFKCVADDYGLEKIAPNVHLYLSEKKAEGFPGKAYEICGIYGNDKKSMRELSEKYNAAEIACRNYYDSSESLRKKLKMQEGGDIRIFAVRTEKESMIIACRKNRPQENSIENI